MSWKGGYRIKKHSGFTLIELAIVQVTIGLLLSGVLKGQELINRPKVKNMAANFRNVPVYIYGYQDKYKALPRDNSSAVDQVGATVGGNGDGKIDGVWNSVDSSVVSAKFWERIRRTGLTPGSNDITRASATSGFFTTNSDGGRIGVTSQLPIVGLPGAYFMC